MGAESFGIKKPLLTPPMVLALVDSEVQVSRTQVLRGKQTSIRNMFKQSNRLRVYNDREFRDLNTRFERGFCVNVLSVIPSYARRREILDVIHG